jgi:hypothetical protein
MHYTIIYLCKITLILVIRNYFFLYFKYTVQMFYLRFKYVAGSYFLFEVLFRVLRDYFLHRLLKQYQHFTNRRTIMDKVRTSLLSN